jgi:prepilin-type N-terminal cleavage/methylation domain-containing protein
MSVPDPEQTFNPSPERKPMTTFAPSFPSASIRRHAFNEDGFTMIEILTVIAITGILAAIAIPTLADVQARNNVLSVLRSEQKVQAAVDKWKNDHGPFNEVDTEAFGDIISQQPDNFHIKVVRKDYAVNGVNLKGDYQIHGWADEGEYTESDPIVLDPLVIEANTFPVIRQ